MLVLGLAYGLVEEGLVDQMLFNQSYFTGQEGLSRSTPRPRARPWLKAPGLMLVAVIFTVGSAWLCCTVYQETGFFAWVPQLLGTSVVAVALVVAALTGMRRGSAAGA